MRTRMGDAMIRTEHTMNLYDVALSVVRARARPRLIGSTVIREFSYGLLTIRYQPERGSLDIWFAGKGLAVQRWCGKPQLVRYEPGSWEGDLMEAAKVAA
jgi:hypothetical protein